MIDIVTPIFTTLESNEQENQTLVALRDNLLPKLMKGDRYIIIAYMEENISKKYLMQLIETIETTLWEMFPKSKYRNVRFYVEKWHHVESDWNNSWENFTIYEDTNKNIDLLQTLHNIEGETLLKIAIDLGIETPDFIPCVPTFKNILKDKYKSASDTFNKAISNIEDNPDLAIGLANSTLESIIKEIILDGHMTIVYDEKLTLYKLTESILKGFGMFPNTSIPKEIKNIGSSLLNICQNIECLRSSQTSLHGKSNSDYIIDESLYAYFVVNSVSTVGLFIHSFYKTKFLVEVNKPVVEDKEVDLPF